ncbi:MAG TPA: glycosyltransferase [bacterium]|nr:glycosyltransferase [bacterium]
MRRILVITNRYPCDADDPASPFVPHFVEALRGCGVAVDVLTPRYTHRPVCPEAPSVHRFETGASSPVGCWNLASPASWVRLKRFVAAGHELGRALCQSHRYDHIFALWALPSGEFARRLSREYGIPYSVWCLGSDIYSWSQRPFIGAQIARVLRDAAQVFGDGEDICERVKSWLGLGCRFLPSFRPLSGELPMQAPSATAAPRYLYLGRIHRAKGTRELLLAFAEVIRSLPAARLRFVGDGPDLASLREEAETLGIAPSVAFTGPVGRTEILDAYRQCDFVVIPTKSDSLPLVFSEAAQAHRPVIGTDVGDLGVMIRRFHLGIVCDSADPALLAAAMRQMADSPVFSAPGRERLLKLLDPRGAAVAFCRSAFGAEFTAAPEPALSRDHKAARPDVAVHR